MVTPAMITLLGVGHVFDIGAAIRAEVLARRPKVVALELDPIRYQAIMSREPRRRGWSVLGVLAQFQVRIADQYGVQVGDEMAAAARAAQEIGSEVAVVGEGHVEGPLHHLAGVPLEIVHLEQLRSAPVGPNASVNVSVHL